MKTVRIVLISFLCIFSDALLWTPLALANDQADQLNNVNKDKDFIDKIENLEKFEDFTGIGGQSTYRLTYLNGLKEYFKENNIDYKEVFSIKGNILSKLINLIYFLDYCSIYYAVLSETDPTPIRSIDYVKRKL